jgi:hypothetical protein
VTGISSHVMFVARGKMGPFRFTTEVVGGAAETRAVRTLVHDDGADHRLITAATHVFRCHG